MNKAVLFSRASDEWATPQDRWLAWHAEFRFVLDVAATALNTKCSYYLGPDNVTEGRRDALTMPWALMTRHRGACWMNPPYSQCRAFMAKAAAEAAQGACIAALVPSRTDTRWWHDQVWDQATHAPRPGVQTRFLKGRLTFGGASAGAPFPSVLVVFGYPNEPDA